MSSRSAIVLLLGLALAACDRQTPGNGQATAASGATASDEVRGRDRTTPPAGAGSVDRSQAGARAPAVAFRDAAGRRVTLASFAGRPLLLNLWATWCAPCVRELPALDALAAAPGGGLRVVAVSQDMEPAKVAPFLRQRSIRRLAAHTDAEMALSLAYHANLPTTVLIDSRGREVWRVAGALDWTGDAARRLVAEAR